MCTISDPLITECWWISVTDGGYEDIDGSGLIRDEWEDPGEWPYGGTGPEGDPMRFTVPSSVVVNPVPGLWGTCIKV